MSNKRSQAEILLTFKIFYGGGGGGYKLKA